MKEVVETIEIKKYVAEDGTSFKDEWDCKSYENEQAQRNLEQEAIAKLGIKTVDSNFPSMINLRNNPQYMLFLIENEDDLEIFCKAYEDYWFSGKAWQLNRETFVYPEVLCIVDFERGSEDYRLYRMSQLFGQFYAFEEELNTVIQKKQEENK